MDQTLTKDARNLVDGVVSYLRKDSKTQAVAPKVQELFNKVTVAARKEKTANVVSSVALTQNEKQSITQILTKSIGHPVELVCSVDPDTLGGFRIQIADWIIDMTLASQLTLMAEQITQ